MKLLDRYTIKQFTKNFLLVFGSLVSIYLLVDFFEKIDNFVEAHKPIGLAIRYFIFKIPLIYDQLIPVCIMLAGILTLGLMNHNKELQALKAGGISLTRIVKPLIGIAMFFTLISIGAAQWLLPLTNAETNRIWYKEVKQKISSGIVRNGIVYYRGIEGIYSFTRPDPTTYLFTSFRYVSWDDDYSPRLLIAAETANWENGNWLLTDGQLRRKTDKNDNIELFQSKTIKLPDSPENFFVPTYQIEELSLWQLLTNSIHDWKEDKRENWVDLNRRLSYIFLGIPLLLIGIPVVLLVNQNWGRDLTMAVPISCGLAFVAWGIWSANQAMTNAAYLNPVLASWLIHFIVASIGIFLIRLQDR